MSDAKNPSELIPKGGDSTKPNQHGGNHEVIHGDGSHITWDTNREGLYIPGTGHTTIHPPGPLAPRIPPTPW